ncbi:MAG: MATE family efflux transporter [Ruminococcus sp.]|nr:MATE family efflux transporter [Ruminococcus sp.]
MNNKNDLTTGSIGKTVTLFALPYLLSCFMQTFYGMVDLFVVGLYNGPETTTAVSIGSQVTHMLTVIIVGLAMGATVRIGQSVGAKDERTAKKTIGTTVIFFIFFAIAITVILTILTRQITSVMMTPTEAFEETAVYLLICFAGIPFIVAYNVISSIFRGMGDSKRPMYFVAVACVTNIVLDFLFIGIFKMGAAGAALGTVCGQAVSVFTALFVMIKKGFGLHITRSDFSLHKNILADIIKVGVPIALQDGLIQVAFIVITVIANSRGLIMATSVGIVEKLIGFMFLVPSAFLSAISAITAQNLGAGKKIRAKQALRYGLCITVAWGIICVVYNQFLPQTLVGLFTKDNTVVAAGCDYLRAYAFDCLFAAIHFCFSGYFCGSQRSGISFLHNIISIIVIRVPGAYLASLWFPDTLYPMGWAAPLGSVLSALICIGFYVYYNYKDNNIKLRV